MDVEVEEKELNMLANASWLGRAVCAAAVSASLVLIAPADSSAAGGDHRTIDFEHLRHDDDLLVNHGPTVTEDGFILTDLGGAATQLATHGTLHPYFSGSTAITNQTTGAETELRAVDGSVFDLLSIDITERNSGGGWEITFTGFPEAGGTVTQVFNLDEVLYQPETCAFGSDFTGLTKVHWTEVYPFAAYDNIEVVIPEPAGAALLAMGGLAILRRRRS
ncbi:MAG: PEP-CTERM sorting domain-containing protein [Planctomycetota bacterium]|jgi:hypothetical protein